MCILQLAKRHGNAAKVGGVLLRLYIPPAALLGLLTHIATKTMVYFAKTLKRTSAESRCILSHGCIPTTGEFTVVLCKNLYDNHAMDNVGNIDVDHPHLVR